VLFICIQNKIVQANKVVVDGWTWRVTAGDFVSVCNKNGGEGVTLTTRAGNIYRSFKA